MSEYAIILGILMLHSIVIALINRPRQPKTRDTSNFAVERDTMIEQTKQKAEEMAEMYEAEAQSLIDIYGTGVRPSWVSTDLAIANERARMYKKMADRLNKDWT